jgi:hypothetical protein
VTPIDSRSRANDVVVSQSASTTIRELARKWSASERASEEEEEQEQD